MLVEKMAVGHPHPESGGARNLASKLVDSFILKHGRTVYSVSMSYAESKQNVRGSRYYYEMKDLVMSVKNDYLLESDIIKMIDTDYHVPDLGYWASFMKPMLFYSFNPVTPAGQTMDGFFCTNANGEVTVRTAMGTCYQHHLWDHENDFVAIPYGGFDHYFYCEQRRIPKTQYCLILYHPAYRVFRFMGRFMQPCPILKRRNDVYGEFAVTSVINSKSLVTYVTKVGRFYASAIETESLYSLIDRAKAYEKAFSYVTIKDLCRHSKIFFSKKDAAMLLDYINSAPRLPQLRAYSADNVTYQCTLDADLLVEQSRDVARIGHEPFVDGGSVPLCSKTSEKMAAKDRVVDLIDPDQGPLSEEMLVILHEFCDQLFGQKTLNPIDTSSVLDLQSRQSQIDGYLRSLPNCDVSPLRIKAFWKKEAYDEAKSPRMITECDAAHRTAYSRYTLALAAHLKRFGWYAFGYSPNKIAQRVHKICSTSAFVVETDYSRFDGLHGLKLHQVECIVMERAFGKSSDAPMLCRRETNLRATTRSGVKYKTAYTRLSGSPSTSVMNTLDNAFVCFYYLRVSESLSPAKAFKKLGVYAGDDGITAARYPKALSEVASSFGAKLKCVVRRKNQWVSFLGRIYVAPGSCDASIYDLRRFIAKAHITVAGLDVPMPLAFARKAYGFSVTDSNTPLIKEWIGLIRTWYGHGDNLVDNSQYYAKMIVDNPGTQFPQLDAADHRVLAVVRELVPEFDNIIKNLSNGEIVAPYPKALKVSIAAHKGGHKLRSSTVSNKTEITAIVKDNGENTPCNQRPKAAGRRKPDRQSAPSTTTTTTATQESKPAEPIGQGGDSPIGQPSPC